MKTFASLVLLGGLLLAACVSDTTTAAAVGSLGGACFSNGTCNAGLSCVLVGGTGTCEVADASAADGSSPNDAAPGMDGANGSDSSDASATVCTFQEVAFPCSSGSGADCEAPSLPDHCAPCSGPEQTWYCFSRPQCSGTDVCCAPTQFVNPSNLMSHACTGNVDINYISGSIASTCKPSCATNDAQLCQANAECPTGQTCVPATVVNTTISYFTGKTFGICSP